MNYMSKFFWILKFKLEVKNLVYPIFKKNIYSQNGEDGVLEYIMVKLEHIPRNIIDIGANDGVCCSNSRMLIEKYNFSALLIEPFEKVFIDLEGLYLSKDNVQTLNVALGEKNSDGYINWHGVFADKPCKIHEANSFLLDNIPQSWITEGIGVLTIDIDGYDNSVLASINWSKIKPWIVIAEIDSCKHENLQEQINIMHKGGVFSIPAYR